MMKMKTCGNVCNDRHHRCNGELAANIEKKRLEFSVHSPSFVYFNFKTTNTP